jgi:flagellar motor protein MotB
MGKKKEPEGEANFERWLLPYADMITLLLAFFIIMYALTLMEKEKAAKIMEEMSKAFGSSASSTPGTPGLVSGGKKMPNPMVESTGVYKKGTNKKVSYIENTGKRPTVGNIMNVTALDITGESVYIGTDAELIEKIKAIDSRLLGDKDNLGDKGKENIRSRDILIKVGKNKKIPDTGEISLAGGAKKAVNKEGENDGDKGGKSPGEKGGDGDEEGYGGDEEGNFKYKVNDPYLESIAARLASIFSEEIKSASLEVKVTQRGIEIIISGDIMFELGSIEIMPESIKVIKRICAALMYLSQFGFNFRVEGHTDNINVHSFLYPSNWELSCARAVAVVRYMTEELNLAPETVSASGFGRFRPMASNATPEGRKKNRRIEILIYDPLKPLDASEELNKKSDTYYKERLEKLKNSKNKQERPGEVKLSTSEIGVENKGALIAPGGGGTVSVSAAAVSTAEAQLKQPPVKVMFAPAKSGIEVKGR